eukprot:1189378-Rhodomonas_salina.2
MCAHVQLMKNGRLCGAPWSSRCPSAERAETPVVASRDLEITMGWRSRWCSSRIDRDYAAATRRTNNLQGGGATFVIHAGG